VCHMGGMLAEDNYQLPTSNYQKELPTPNSQTSDWELATGYWRLLEVGGW